MAATPQALGLVYAVAGHAADYAISEGPPPAVLSANGTSLRIGANNNTTPGGGRNAVLVFALPPLTASNETAVAARLTFTVVGRAGSPTFNADLWAIGIRTNSAPMLAYFEADFGDTSAVKLDDNLILPDATNGMVISSTNSVGLGSYLQDFYATNAGYAGGAYLFLRMTPDADAGTGSLGWSISSAEGTAPPTLTLTTSASASQDHRNFLIMITDDQRWDAMGVVQREFGAQGRFPWFTNQTPNMDRLAAGGLRFRNAFVTYPLCSPSRAAILTGRYNHLNGIIDNFTPFPTNAITFATQLRAAGYTTGWAGKFHMDSQRERPGFDYSASYIGHGQYNDATFVVNGVNTVTSGWVDDVATDYALGFLDANQGRPFALVVGFKSPHSPRTPPARHANLYTNAVARHVPSLNHLAPYRTAPATINASDTLNYFRCLKGVDDNVGRLLDRLDLLGLTTNTMVIYCSDNGYYLGEHGLSDKRSMYEESMRIPLLVRYPHLIQTPAVREEIVLNIDFAPTMLDLAGLAIHPTMQGRSWRPLLESGAAADWRRSFFCEYFLEVQQGTNTPTVFAVRTPAAKLAVYPGHPQLTELFDIAADPYETNNVFNSLPQQGLREDMQTEFEQLASSTGLRASMRPPLMRAGTFEWELAGGVGPRWQVEQSADFRNWQFMRAIKMTSTSTNIGDPASGTNRFYRLRMAAD